MIFFKIEKDNFHFIIQQIVKEQDFTAKLLWLFVSLSITVQDFSESWNWISLNLYKMSYIEAAVHVEEKKNSNKFLSIQVLIVHIHKLYLPFNLLFISLGNMFSSLEGLEVIWELKTVEGVGSVSAQSVLRYPHITDRYLSTFEKRKVGKKKNN